MRHKLCRSFHPWCPGVKTRCLSANERRPNMAARGGMVFWTLNQALRRKKKTNIKAFLVIQRWSKISMNTKFDLCDESNPINPRCGKISANFCISPPHPQFYPQKWWKFRYTSGLTPTHINSRHSGTVQWKGRTFVCITKTLAQKVWCTIASNFS